MGSIDADAHVIESEATFRFLDPQYKHLEPIPITRKESDAAEYAVDGRKLNEYWVIDGRLQPRQFNLGVNTTPRESREMTDVQARLSHMDELEIDIQVLYPTLYLRAFTEDPTVEYARAKLPTVGTFHSLILERVAERYPRLRWGFIEVSAQWIPYALNDLAIRFRRRSEVLSDTPLADNNIYVACQVTDDLDYVLKSAGEDNLVIGTDYGHSDTSTEIEALRKLGADGRVPAAVTKKILDDNARALYGL